ncbi:SMP-30/gluconolactonase/LRE family protein [Deinococcus roseus]|uniref:SMP-30/Gluconolactonase/LRE-like region domain-containing protein n=1 Tax=Deinococcus roseus TaxID=392414 RepID=A0ABQ2D3F0_9DEIO|nr:SMP-30/gluconolactonase/LRE family protein [Deinococcus roseus]GGJ43072.1 hypothetical protein GCM10008938_31620 [Deinococcus roseus]
MKTLFFWTALTFAGLSAAWAAPLEILGFETPESVLYDAQADIYLVSNINGNPTSKDNNGFISQVSPDGQILSSRWIAGGTNGVTLHAPKGTAIVGDLLYVADIDTVRLFDRKTGQFLRDVVIQESSFLNDLVADAQGNVYVSDSGLRSDFSPSGTDAICKIAPDDQVTVLASGKSLAQPNGLLVQQDGTLLVAPMASNELYRVGENGREEGSFVRLPGGDLDGLVQVGSGYLVSSWATHSILQVSGTGEVTVLLGSLSSPADIGHDQKRNRLLIPLVEENSVVLLDL